MPLALILALVASLGLHALAMFGPDLDLAAGLDHSTRFVQAELRPLPSLAKDTLISRPSPKKMSSRKPGFSPLLRESGIPAVSDSAGEMPQAVPMPAATTAEVETPSLQEIEEDVAVEPATISPAHQLSDAGQILYRIDRGDSGFEIGRAISEWALVDGNYVLRLRTETTGIVWLFKAYRIDMESRGRLTATGLQPEHFLIKRNGVLAGEHADFDWTQMKIQVGENPPQALNPGAQDLLSFNFHLGFMPDPKLARTLFIATGKKYTQYPLETIGDEELELPVGKIRTLHLRAPGSNTTELWLAYDYLLLPVKIRHEDSKSGSFVQVATDIRLGAQ